MALYTNVASPLEIQSIAFGDISTSYAPVGDPFPNATSIISFINLTNAPMLVSLDGNTDHEVVLAGETVRYVLGQFTIEKYGAFLKAYTQIYVKQESGAPSSGSFYTSAWRLERS